METFSHHTFIKEEDQTVEKKRSRQPLLCTYLVLCLWNLYYENIQRREGCKLVPSAGYGRVKGVVHPTELTPLFEATGYVKSMVITIAT